MPELSIVTTLYRSSPYVEEFYERACTAARELSDDFELILVDDGSPDDSLAVARGLLSRDARVKLVALSRNFGHHRAMMTGLEHSMGERVFLIDCDLEEPPECLLEFHSAMDAAPEDDPIDSVYGVQRRRKGGLLERTAGWLFYRVINLLSTVQVPSDVVIARLMTRRYVDSLLRHGEREYFILGLLTLTGFRQVGIPIDKGSRDGSSYGLMRRASQMLGAVASFSDRPLTAVFAVGITVTCLAGLAMAYVVFSSVTLGADYLAGWQSTLGMIALFGGLILSSLGVIGFYLGRVLLEVKARPVIVKSVESRPYSRPR